jgi:hypothetical protein
MKKKRPLLFCALALLLVGLLGGCGSNKNLNPGSDIVFEGADPPSANYGVSPPLPHLAYFVFSIRIDDPNLSLIASDAWTVDSADISYSVVSDPGHHLVGVPPARTEHIKAKVAPYTPTRSPVSMVEDGFLAENAAGFLGTTDTATVKVHLVFRAHRNKDGLPKVIRTNYFFNVGNY